MRSTFFYELVGNSSDIFESSVFFHYTRSKVFSSLVLSLKLFMGLKYFRVTPKFVRKHFALSSDFWPLFSGTSFVVTGPVFSSYFFSFFNSVVESKPTLLPIFFTFSGRIVSCGDYLLMSKFYFDKQCLFSSFFASYLGNYVSFYSFFLKPCGFFSSLICANCVKVVVLCQLSRSCLKMLGVLNFVSLVLNIWQGLLNVKRFV